MLSARRRPSLAVILAGAALVAALAALIVSMAGTATGLPGKNRVDGNDLRPRVVGPIHMKRNSVRPWQVAPNAVAHFHLRAAYMRVTSTGAVVNHRNIVGVNKPGPRVYCLNLRFDPIVGVATREVDNGGGHDINVTAERSNALGVGCPASHADALVQLPGAAGNDGAISALFL